MNKNLHKSLYILPSLFTLANLAFGYFGIIAALHQNWLLAGQLISWAAIMDGLDGRVARLTKTTSSFGMNFDSISDMISFGVAPATVIYLKWLKTDPVTWTCILPFLFISAGAFRLARFNVDSSDNTPTYYFKGLPIPAGAGVLATSLWMFEKYFHNYDHFEQLYLKTMPFLIVILSYLMISKIKYYSFKRMKFLLGRPYLTIVFLITFISLLIFKPGEFLFCFAWYYVFTGPIKTIFNISKIYNKKEKEV